jgi:hypothetical protein
VLKGRILEHVGRVELVLVLEPQARGTPWIAEDYGRARSADRNAA